MADEPSSQHQQATEAGQNAQATGPTKPKQGRLGMILAATGLAVVLAAYITYDAWAKQGMNRPVKAVLMCATTQCAYTETRAPRQGEAIPTQCPKCGAKTLYPTMTCPKCKTRNILNEMRGLAGPSTCSKCGTELHYGD